LQENAKQQSQQKGKARSTYIITVVIVFVVAVALELLRSQAYSRREREIKETQFFHSSLFQGRQAGRHEQQSRASIRLAFVGGGWILLFLSTKKQSLLDHTVRSSIIQ